MKIVSHIVNDSEQAAAVSEKLTADLNRFIKSVYGENATDASWQQFAHETEGGCENITASFYEVVNGQAYEQMDEILSVIDTLKNGSYGMLLVDTDYGVAEYKCYGDSEFTAISSDEAAGFTWSTDDMICLEKQFTPGELAELLDCDTDSVCDEAEDQAEKLAPEIVSEIYPDADDELFGSCEAEETDDSVTVRCMLAFHDHTTEQLFAWKDAFENGKLAGWTLRLSESAEDNGRYKNTMICPDANAVLMMTTSSGSIHDIQFTSMQERKN